ncbi:MAG TPA: hypothetical protein VM598_11940 [Bdellovibrionota bacterium]|nr:hypothetical protein [Bdellovibrionota bacterium]
MSSWRSPFTLAILAGLLGVTAEAGQSLSVDGESWCLTAQAEHVEIYRRPRLKEKTDSDQAFAVEMSVAIGKAAGILGVAPSRLRFLFIDASYPRLPRSPIKFFGFVDYDLNAELGDDFVLLDPSFGLGPGAIHAGIHDYQHIVARRLSPDEPRWIQEGMSELLAWRVTGILPSISVSAFLEKSSPLALRKTGIGEYGMADYGQSYLLFRFVWERLAGDRLFGERPAKWLQEIGLEELYRRFAISLSVPNLVASGEYGWSERVFTRAPIDPSQGSIPGFSSALVDVGVTLLDRGRLEVSAPAPLIAYMIELKGQEARIRPLSDVVADRGYAPGRRISLLVINPTGDELSYSIR